MLRRETWICFLLMLLCTLLGAQEIGPDPPDDIPPSVLKSDHSYSHEQLLERLKEIQGEVYQSEAQEALLTLFLDGRHLGDILGLVTYDGRLPKLRYRDVKELFGDSLDDDTIILLGEQQDLHGWVSVINLEAYEPNYDSEGLQIHFTTPPEKRGPGAIDLMRKHRPNLDLAQHPRCNSAYINFFNSLRHNNEVTQYTLDSEWAIRRSDWVFNGFLQYQSDRHSPFQYRHLQATRDYTHSMTRLTIGETQSFYPRVLTNDQIQGIRYATEYELDPFSVTEPQSEYSFFLDQDATVEVWVNGQFVRTLRLKAGPYDVANFPLNIGLNRVRLQIRDISGREKTLTFSTIKGPNLLAPGRKEFSYSLGVRGRADVYSDEPVLSMFCRRGVSETRTQSVEFQLAPDHAGLGLGMDFARSWAYGSADIASTVSDPGIGGAGRFIIARNFSKCSGSFRGDYRSQYFLAPEQTVSATRLRSLLELSVNIPRASRWGSLRLRAANITRWNGDDELTEELTWYYTFNERWTFQLNARHSHTGTPSSDVNGILSYRLAGKKMIRSHDLQMGADQRILRSSLRSNSKINDDDWLVQHQHSFPADGDTTDSLRGIYNWRHNRFLASYSGEVGDFGDQNDIEHTVLFNTSVAFAGGSMAWGQPILNSFALVELDPALGDVQVDVHSLGIKHRACQASPALVWNLRPYYPAYLTPEVVEQMVLVDDKPFFLLPHDHSGFVLTVRNPDGEGGNVTVEGVLHDAYNTPLKFKALRVSRVNATSDPVISFTNGSGFFQINGLLPGEEYIIEVGLVPDSKEQSESHYPFTLPLHTSPGTPIHLGILLPNGEEYDPEAPQAPVPPIEPMQLPVLEPKQQAEAAPKPKPTTQYQFNIHDAEVPYRVDADSQKAKQRLSQSLNRFRPGALTVVPLGWPQVLDMNVPSHLDTPASSRRINAAYRLLYAQKRGGMNPYAHTLAKISSHYSTSGERTTSKPTLSIEEAQSRYWKRRSLLPLFMRLIKQEQKRNTVSEHALPDIPPMKAEPVEAAPPAVAAGKRPRVLYFRSWDSIWETSKKIEQWESLSRNRRRYHSDPALLYRLTSSIELMDRSRPVNKLRSDRWTVFDLSKLLLGLDGKHVDTQPHFARNPERYPLTFDKALPMWQRLLAFWNIRDHLKTEETSYDK